MKNQITLVAIDTSYHKLTQRALDHTVQLTGIENVLVISDQDLYPGARWIPVTPITKTQYNEISFCGLAEYIDTEFVMTIQHDGIPVHNNKWNDEFFNYDYIGAIWPWLPEGKNVGNSGFCLRSRKLLNLCSNLDFNPPDLDDYQADDVLICRYYRDYLEANGIKFAPSSIAREFSQETINGDGQSYGFHGEACMPYYLDNTYMEFYIEHMTANMFQDLHRIGNIFFGLYHQEKYDHVGLLVEQGIAYDLDFKEKLIHKLSQGNHHLSNLTRNQLEELLINY